ncbi:cysteine-tryptophan domain-containing zinc finger protein 7-like [Tasmannia lanceolata]|uniref:cysteine-tryptophan domain-containing zinc finger protein 7-like n=1 Tax=Tasmannia lanceolata TaxID=3420 RepID=UPI004063551C
MLSVESRDGRKELGLCVEGEMEGTELEEGEASYYQGDDANIDPDIALSYLDEKLQDVLGHFQKDFEGGVSAENLGAKFGGYGSFLPAYQRSPSIWSHPKTPQKVQNYSAPKSPNNLPLEGSRQNHLTQTSASHSVRLFPASNSARPISAIPSVDNSAKRELVISTSHVAGDLTPKNDSGDKSANATDLKTLKVRLKVGPDNVLARKNAAIYSGLGLDNSPSSSLEESPDGSSELSPDVRDACEESPMTVLRIMTAFPVSGGLHSPLLDSIFGLTKKEKPFPKDNKPCFVRKAIQEIPTKLADEPPSVNDMKRFAEKKLRSSVRNGRSMGMKSAKDKFVEDDMSSLLKKEIDIETPLGRELVSNALKIANETVEGQTSGETLKGTGRAFDLSRELNKGATKDKALPSDLVKEEGWESSAIQDTYKTGNLGNEMVPLKGKLSSKTSSAEKIWDEKREIGHKEFSFDRKKDGRCDKNNDTSKAGRDGFKARKDHSSGPVEHLKQKVTQKAMPLEQDGVKMLLGKEHPSGSKKKPKGNQSNGTTALDFPKENSSVNSSTASKDKKKSFQGRDQFPENRSDSMEYRKELGKPVSRDYHRDSLGDIKAEPVEEKTNSLETHFKVKQRDSKLDVEKETHGEKLKERLGSKKVEYLSTSEEYTKEPAVTALAGNGPTLEAVTAPVAPVVIEENWVCCDKCQKWRLLPFGTNPDHLPKKWLCSMLNWLPGMNKCTISEEETTKALNALYQVPVPDSQNNLHSQHDGPASGIALTDLQHFDQSNELSLHSMPSGGKKKHGSKDASNALSHATPIHLPNSTKKSQLGPVKGRSLNDSNHYPLESNPANKIAFQHTSQSNDFGVEKHIHKQKEKHKLLDRYSDGGDYVEQSGKHSKAKSKREAYQESYITSKKIKTDASHYSVVEDLHSEHDVKGIAVPSLSNGFLTKVSGKNPQKHDGYFSSKDSKGNRRDNLLASGKNLKAPVQVSLNGENKTLFRASDVAKSDKNDFAAKKRKVKEWQESQSYSESLLKNEVSLKEETSESGIRKEKKARVSKSEGKESSTSNADGKTDRKGRVTKILLSASRDPLPDEENRGGNEKEHLVGQYRGNTMSQRTLDGIDSLKRDLGYAQPSMAATSSSSKVSGSRRSKANLQEVKGSPVESVSSSPLRLSNTENLLTARGNFLGKDDATNIGISVLSNPTRCLDGKGDGGSDRSRTGKHKTIMSHGASEPLAFDYLGEPYDYHDKGANQISDSKPNDRVLSMTYEGIHGEPSPPEFENINVVNGVGDLSDQHNPYLNELRGKDHDHNTEKLSNHRVNGSSQRKSGKSSSSRSRDRYLSAKSDFDRGKIKVSDSFSEKEDLYPAKSAYGVHIESHDRPPQDLRDGKYNFREKGSMKSEKNYLGKKDFITNGSNEGRIYYPSKFGVHESFHLHGSPLPNKQRTDFNSGSGKSDAICNKDGKSNMQEKPPQVTSRENEKLSNRVLSHRTDGAELVSGIGKLLPSTDKQETQSRGPTAVQHKGGRSDILPVDVSNGDALKVPKQPRKPDNENGTHHSSLRQSTANGIVGKDLDARSPLRKDSCQVAANVLKEAKDLKHSADRLKSGGHELEGNALHFRAALKFLHAALLLEPSNVESAKHGDMTQSMQVYTDTAKLCEFCAHQYEKCKDMAAAALAYKCMEVAYMRVIYSKNSSASKDRHELQASLQIIPPGESPSSSASDVDNLNNHATLDKVALTKYVNYPQATSNHVIVARNRPGFVRLLDFAQDATSAMEALRKSQNAFAAASLEEAHYGTEGLSTVRRVLDFNFHDVEGLLRLVRLAMEVISH